MAHFYIAALGTGIAAFCEACPETCKLIAARPMYLVASLIVVVMNAWSKTIHFPMILLLSSFLSSALPQRAHPAP